ncbi:glycosyltransferase family 4 protein, partial [Candidatus Uhrbacteria bacterium]|nr:glycosyltransferase family 4 protein [Candidatus Uhrbacteria bacterium]
MADVSNKPSLIFITQKIHQDDDDLAFIILWIKEFIRQGIGVQVICLEKGEFDGSFPVHSLSKENGYGTLRRACRFLKLIFTLEYDRVFVHMNPEYFTLGGWYWWLKRVPMYLWYTHYTMHAHMRLAGWLCKRLFAATRQSLPQYEGSPKKVITGHGIDVDFWRSTPSENNQSPQKLLTVHRLCRSKRLEFGIMALKYLPEEYSLTVYGRDVEKDYVQELLELVTAERLEHRVTFKGPLPMHQLKEVYAQHRVMVNMASETIDKTMLEGMLFGVYPITTKTNSEAIGLPASIGRDDPKEIAKFILSEKWKPYDSVYLANIVKDRHSLSSLV